MKNILVLIHALTGIVALLAGLMGIAASKVSLIYRYAEKAFFGVIMILCFTAILLCIYIKDPFFPCIAVFTFYLSVTSHRFISIGQEETIQIVDKIIFISGFLAAIGMTIVNIYLYLSRKDATPIILTIFSIIFIMTAYSDLSYYILSANKKDKIHAEKITQLEKKSNIKWLYEHISRMIGAYTAIITAFIVINLRSVPPLFGWVAPTLLGFVLIRVICAYNVKKIKNDSTYLARIVGNL